MISPEEEKELLELKKRHDNALEYEKTKYKNDTPEGRAWAEQEFLKILKRMNELWCKMTEDQRDKYKKLWECDEK